ncbi:MAG TPA: ATP-binding protein [Burkholderiaceae bacterium]|jgi:two-component system sensor histidine kinase BaeS
MKRPGITARLALYVLALATLIVVAMSVAGRISFKRDFLGTLNHQAVERMEAALPRLGQAYAEHGSWAFMQGREDLWYDIVGSEVRALPQEHDRHADLPSAVATDLLGAGRRLTLLDAQRHFVIGFPVLLHHNEQRPVVVNGQVVGWLAMASIQSVADEVVDQFLDGQLRGSLLLGVAAILLSSLVAWWLARSLLGPVRSVARASHRLAAGDYSTRIEVKGHDEVAQLAQDFNQLAVTLDRNERMRRDYMADVSHELRTPLAVLRGELEAMEDGVHAPTPESLRMLQGEVATLTQLVGDLHELALADVGALSYRKVDLDLTRLLEEESAAFRPRCTEAGLELSLQSPGESVTLLADEARMRQLLHNVLENSVRYTAKGGRLLLQLRVEDDQAVLDLHDSAPGVAPELLPRLFERFYRVEASRGRASGGSGLGLSICRRIVEAHGGRIEARASHLGGVWMEIRLPVTLAPTEAAT